MLSTVAALLLASASPSNAARFFAPELLQPKSCGLFSNARSELTSFTADWYGKAFTSGQEPSLYERSRRRGASEEYRFTYLPSFDHPLIVRITAGPDGALQMVAKELSGAGGYEPERVLKQIDRVLSPVEAASFRKALVANSIVRLPSTRCERSGVDGEQWILEAVDSSGYHFAQRWSPTHGPAYNLGVAFVRLTRWGTRL